MNEIPESELEQEQIDPNSDEGECLDPVMEPFNPTDIDIVVEPKSMDALIQRINHEEIDMNTDFQRHADLWDNQKMSRLIESILIRFPLPAFYFDASEDSNWLIVDGLQRLSSIRKFVIDKKLKLSGLEFLKDLNGKGYDQLHRTYQRRITECPVTVYLIKPGTPNEVKYSVFRRINTGGITLNNQEIRNAMAKQKDRRFLEKLATKSDTIAMLGDLSKRMIDQELILRFWAFYRFDYLSPKNKKEIASFLDRAMDELKNGTEEYRELMEKTFDTAICRCRSLLGERGFEKNGDARWSRKNSSLFEVWMVSLAKLDAGKFDILMRKNENFRIAADDLKNDPEFFNSITYSTQKEDHVRSRYSKVYELIEEYAND